MTGSFFTSDAQSAAFLSSIIDTATDGIFIMDEYSIIHVANPAAAELFGYKQEELRGRNVNILMPSPHRERHADYVDNYLKTGQAKIIGIGREIEAMRRDGTLFPARLAVSEVKFDNRRFFAGFIHDLTDVKDAEEHILRLNEQLESKVQERTEELQDAVNRLLTVNTKLEHEISERQAAEQALRNSQKELRRLLKKEKELSELKSRFVSMASHEFRTPLSTILSSAALIRRYTKAEDQEKRNKHLARIQSSVNLLTGILNDFLSLSKIEEGHIALNTANVDVRALGIEVADEIEGLLKSGQRIEHASEDDTLTLQTDRNILKNIMFNLLSNAVKYSGPDTEITCRYSREKDKVRIDVADEGIGIPETEQKHMFMRFFRASNATNIQGTGLGLNIVAGYLDLLGGSITFESEEGKGSEFSIILPQLDGYHSSH